MPQSYDKGSSFSTFQKTSRGTLLVEGYPTRTGVLKYLRNGALQDELRPPEELVKVLDQIAHSPIVGEHRTFKPDDAEHLEGLVIGEVVLQDDGWVKTKCHMLVAQAIDDIEAGKRRQLSGGYDEVRHEKTPGWWDPTSQTYQLEGAAAPPNFQRERAVHFDVVQRDLVYNHTKLCTVGRAGSKGGVVYDEIDGFDADIEPTTEARRDEMDVEIELDGIKYKVPHAVAAAFRTEAKVLEKARDEAEAKVKGYDEQIVTLKAERDTAVGQVKALESKPAAAPPAKAHDSVDPTALQERLSVLATGARLGLDYLAEDPLSCTKSNAEIRKDCVESSYDELDLKGSSEAEINGMYKILARDNAGQFEDLVEAAKAAPKATKGRRAAAHDEDPNDDFFNRVTKRPTIQ